MKPLILSFFAVLLGYSFFFDKDDEIKLRNVDQISLESNSTMPERGDSVTLYAKRLPNTPGIYFTNRKTGGLSLYEIKFSC